MHSMYILHWKFSKELEAPVERIRWMLICSRNSQRRIYGDHFSLLIHYFSFLSLFFSELTVFDIRPVSICISRSEIWQIKLCFWKLNYAQDSFLSEIWSKTLEMKTISTVYNCPGPKFFLSCEVEKLNVFGWKLLLSRSRSPLRQYQQWYIFPNYKMNYGVPANHAQSLNRAIWPGTLLLCHKTQVLCFLNFFFFEQLLWGKIALTMPPGEQHRRASKTVWHVESLCDRFTC